MRQTGRKYDETRKARFKGTGPLHVSSAEKLAPRAGFEPATCRLTVECSTAELPGNTAWLRRWRGNTQDCSICQALFSKKIRKLVLSTPPPHVLGQRNQQKRWLFEPRTHDKKIWNRHIDWAFAPRFRGYAAASFTRRAHRGRFRSGGWRLSWVLTCPRLLDGAARTDRAFTRPTFRKA